MEIPGVGPRNLRKLVEKGIGGVAELKQLYKDKLKYPFGIALGSRALTIECNCFVLCLMEN
uniref:Uncharacterized protein n=1 Tax=Fagus sylvatica TaxID=28930 RepID=A0A2N9IHY4_FAGSY